MNRLQREGEPLLGESKPIGGEYDLGALMTAKVSLITEGLYVDDETKSWLSNGNPLTLADYASTSGITLKLGGGYTLMRQRQSIIQILFRLHRIA